MEKVKLYVSYDGGGRPNSFLAMAQTGMDLFRPLAVPFVASPKNLRDLLDAALVEASHTASIRLGPKKGPLAVVGVAVAITAGERARADQEISFILDDRER